MLISKNWLRDFVFLQDALDADELAERLCLSTVEVERVIDQSSAFDHMVVGRIKKVEPHPNADKLKICSVDVGDELLSIVCGGSNVKEGMMVAVAKLGASVRWHGEGEPIVLGRAMIRGIESHGMICASDEIGLVDRFPKKEEKEILDLSHLKIKTGDSLAAALGLDDIIFDIDNKSMTNRPDLWGHYGMAREIATLTRKKFKIMNPPKIKVRNDYSIAVEVKDRDLCPRYMAVAVSGLSAIQSPDWMTRRLEATGIRPINAIVDITNYVMMELGQPMHAFDAEIFGQTPARVVRGGQKKINLTVRRANQKEKFSALDGNEYILANDMLVIANAERSLAIAGVKGGVKSGVTDSTTAVVFEAATFDSVSIRRTSNILALRTDSSVRFEKSLDPYLPELALRRAVELAAKIFPKSYVSSNVADIKNFSGAARHMDITANFVNERLGTLLDKKIISGILEPLGFEIAVKKDTLRVTVPSWRATKDISISEDIVEEVARMRGYETIPAALPVRTIAPAPENALRRLEREIKEALVFQCGLNEVLNYSFVSPERLKNLGLNEHHHLVLNNPIASDRPILRRDLFPGLIENIETNAPRFDSVRLFEIGRVFQSDKAGERAEENGDELLPNQPAHLAIAVAEAKNETPFFSALRCIEVISKRLGLPLEVKSGSSFSLLHPGRSGTIIAGGIPIGFIGELHPRIQRNIIANRVALVELSLSDLAHIPRKPVLFQPIPEFPNIVRDIAFSADRDMAHADILSAISAIDPLIVSVSLFDVYEGEHVPRGKKSMAYRIVYQAVDRTLTADEADAIHKKVESVLKKQFEAVVR